MGTDTIPQYDGVGIWGGGVIAGLLAGLAMGLVMHFGAGLIELLGGLAPIPGESESLGWVIHMLISVVFALVFAATISRPAVCREVRNFVDITLAGVAYGAFL